MPTIATVLKFHLQVGTKRTTVTMDIIISEYLALHLGLKPGTPGASTAIRVWMQARVNAITSKPPSNLSRWLADEALAELIRPELVEARFIYPFM